jgi:hypothetical protein
MEVGAFLLLNGTLSTPHRYITTTADGAVIKRMYDNKLYSLNPRYPEDPQYPYGEKGEDDHVQVIGKVLGTVSADEIPDAEDVAILREIKAEELYEFEREDE